MDEVKPDGLDDFLERFRASHAKEYGYDIPGRAVEVVNCRMQAVGTVPKAPQQPLAEGGALKDAVIERRQVYFGDGNGWVETEVYARARLPVAVPFQGPAVIEEMSSTTVVLPGQSAAVDRIGNIVIDARLDGGT